MKAPKCRLCGESHWGPDHIWQDEDKKKKTAEVIAEIPVKIASELPVKCTDNLPEAAIKCTDISQNTIKCTDNIDGCTDIRQVGIRELGRNLSKELQNLPFGITKGGIVIAVVRNA